MVLMITPPNQTYCYLENHNSSSIDNRPVYDIVIIRIRSSNLNSVVWKWCY